MRVPGCEGGSVSYPMLHAMQDRGLAAPTTPFSKTSTMHRVCTNSL